MIGVTILGSTGSIGINTLDVISQHPNKYKVVALVAKSNIEILLKQCQEHQPLYAVLQDETAALKLRDLLKEINSATEVLSGQAAIQQVVCLNETDYVVAAIVGSIGLLPILAAADAGKRILLANKEALIMGGSLLMKKINDGKGILLPVDSEHNAIFQCMPEHYQTGASPQGVDRIILTASGGPFRCLPLSEFSNITPAQAIAHPNWKMGAKISVDSATMMNKGLEIIEAFWLFNIPVEKIESIIHPQSIIHSLVAYEDGSFLAQLGSPDMRIPITHALAWPERNSNNAKKLDLIEIGQLTFESMDTQRFPCFKLAYQALVAGGTGTILLNAANEIAVQAFLDKKIRFTQIHQIVSETLNKIPIREVDSLETIQVTDNHARIYAEQLSNKIGVLV